MASQTTADAQASSSASVILPIGLGWLVGAQERPDPAGRGGLGV